VMPRTVLPYVLLFPRLWPRGLRDHRQRSERRLRPPHFRTLPSRPPTTVRTRGQEDDAGEQRHQPSYVSPSDPAQEAGGRVCSPVRHALIRHQRCIPRPPGRCPLL